MPLRTSDRPFAGHDLVQHFPALPVVKAYESSRIARHDKLTIRAEGDVNGVTGAVVTFENLLAILSESFCRCVNDDLIVQRLECDGFA